MKSKFFSLSALVFSGILSLSLVGCSGKTDNSIPTTEATETTSNSKIIMGTNAAFPPFETRANDGTVEGFDVELSKKIAAKLGVELEISDVAFNSLFTQLETGKIDFIAAGLTVSTEREANVSFSDTYFDAKQVVLIMSNNTTINTQDDLKGKKIGAQVATTSADIAEEIENATTTTFNAAYSAILDMQKDKIDAVIIDSEPAKQFLKQNPDIKMIDVGFDDEKYAVAVSKDNAELLKVINEVIKELKDSGEYDILIEKYFKE